MFEKSEAPPIAKKVVKVMSFGMNTNTRDMTMAYISILSTDNYAELICFLMTINLEIALTVTNKNVFVIPKHSGTKIDTLL